MQITISVPKSEVFLKAVLATIAEQGLRAGQDADAYEGLSVPEGARLAEVTGPTGVTAVAVECRSSDSFSWGGFLGYTSEGAAFAAEGLDDLWFVLEANGVNGEASSGD